ncbi:unnamed protein product [Cunninghamella echinulata]
MNFENNYSAVYSSEMEQQDYDPYLKSPLSLLPPPPPTLLPISDNNNNNNTNNNKNKHYKMKQSDLYKTEYCRNWAELGNCRYGTKCRYAHGEMELRMIPRHNRYKTQVCRAYHLDGTCSYGNRCTYIHDDIDIPTDIMNQQKNNGTTTTPSITADHQLSDHQDEDKSFLSITTPITSRKESRFFIKDENNKIINKIVDPIMDKNKLWNSKVGLTLNIQQQQQQQQQQQESLFIMNGHHNKNFSFFTNDTTTTTTTNSYSSFSSSLSSSSPLCFFTDHDDHFISTSTCSSSSSSSPSFYFQ